MRDMAPIVAEDVPEEEADALLEKLADGIVAGGAGVIIAATDRRRQDLVEVRQCPPLSKNSGQRL